MRKFSRQKSNNPPAAPIELDFGAASTRIKRAFEPGEYRLRIVTIQIIQNNANVHVALDLIEAESGSRVDIGLLWIDGPNAAAGDLVDKNRHLLAQLLTLGRLPTTGDVGALIPQLAGLEFDGRLVISMDKSGRTTNALDSIYVDDAP